MEANQIREHLVDKGPVVDSLVNQYERVLDDTKGWRAQVISDGAVFIGGNGFMQAHPLIHHIQRAEWTLLNDLRVISRILEAEKKKDEPDEFDAFLNSLAKSTRPHQSRNRDD